MRRSWLSAGSRTEEEIAAYKKARAEAASQEQGIVARGFPEDGEGDGGGE